MSDEYIVRWFRGDDIDHYVEGLNQALYGEYNEEVFDWKFRNGPYQLGFTPIAVAEHVASGTPVAFNSFLPLQVRARDEVFMALQGCDGFVDEAHRRQGLFQRTINFMAEEMRGLSPELLIGFNLVEAAGAAHKAGSALTYDIDKCVLRRDGFTQVRDTMGVELEPITLDRYHMLYEEWAKGSPLLHFQRTLEYLRWRVEMNPVRRVQPYLAVCGGEPRGYVVVDEVSEEGRNYLTIDDYTPGLLPGVLGGVVARLNGLHPDTTDMEINTLRGSALQASVSKLGFTVTPWLKVIMKALNNTVQDGEAVYRDGVELSDVKRWYLSAGDIY